MVNLEKTLSETATRVEAMLDGLLPTPDGPESVLFDAMRYAVFSGGKRIRPFLALESGRLFGVDEKGMARVAAAIECIHTYSLIHDDLPAMDDDDLRRGKPTTHREFDEATAILAGDGLQTLAFEVLSDAETHADPFVRCKLIAHMATAIGGHGMVGGQAIDLSASDNPEMQIGAITRLQRMKTGALIAFACESGALMGRAGRGPANALNAFAHDLGLAFQIVDDLLDTEGDEETVGKAVGKDEEAGKATFVSVLGADRARGQAELLAAQAVAHLDLFDEKADGLRAVAEFTVSRDR